MCALSGAELQQLVTAGDAKGNERAQDIDVKVFYCEAFEFRPLVSPHQSRSPKVDW
jgi:hypothetical protein